MQTPRAAERALPGSTDTSEADVLDITPALPDGAEGLMQAIRNAWPHAPQHIQGAIVAQYDGYPDDTLSTSQLLRILDALTQHAPSE